MKKMKVMKILKKFPLRKKRLAIDFQLAQAVDLMKGLNIYQESFSQ